MSQNRRSLVKVADHVSMIFPGEENYTRWAFLANLNGPLSFELVYSTTESRLSFCWTPFSN